MELIRAFIIATGGLLILLTIAIIGVFFYLRRKYGIIENKVNVLFTLVQEEAQKNQEQQNIVYRENTLTSGVKTISEDNLRNNNQANTNTILTHPVTPKQELIEVSDDETSDLDEDNSDIDSTDVGSDEEDDEGEDEGQTTGVKNVGDNNVKKLELDLEDRQEETDMKINLGEVHINKLSENNETLGEDLNYIENKSNGSYHSSDDTPELKTQNMISYLEKNHYKKMNVSKLRETIQYLDIPIIGNLKQTKKKELLDMIEMFINENKKQPNNNSSGKTFNVNDLFKTQEQVQEVQEVQEQVQEQVHSVKLNGEEQIEHVNDKNEEDNKKQLNIDGLVNDSGFTEVLSENVVDENDETTMSLLGSDIESDVE